MSDTVRDTTEEYDRAMGDPCKTPDKPNISTNDEFAESLNPVREGSTPFKNLKQVGK